MDGGSMVKLTGNDRSRIQHLEKRLREALDKNFYHPPAGASENDYRSYQQKSLFIFGVLTHPKIILTPFFLKQIAFIQGCFHLKVIQSGIEMIHGRAYGWFVNSMRS